MCQKTTFVLSICAFARIPARAIQKMSVDMELQSLLSGGGIHTHVRQLDLLGDVKSA
jgi:hypothetical protein